MKLLITVLVLFLFTACGSVIQRDENGVELLKELREKHREANQRN
jgi:hypothetical protein